MASKRKAAYHNDLGVLLEKEGELTDALEQYRLARTEDPDLILAYINAGNVNVSGEGEASRAQDHFRKSMEIYPSSEWDEEINK